jgi:DNA polymerase III sliding clamp (beta) subunit (PCNA family)
MTMETDTITNETALTRSVIIDAATIASINSLVVFAEPKSGVTPVIQGVNLICTEDNQLTVVVTNRYVAVKATYEDVTFDTWELGAAVWLDPNTLKQAAVLSKATNYAPVTIGDDIANDVTYIAIGETTFKHSRSRSSYPPVERLFPDTEPNGAATLRVNPKWLAMLSKVVVPEVRPDKDRPWALSFWSEDGTKPKPMLAAAGVEGKYQISVLIQPNLIVR